MKFNFLKACFILTLIILSFISQKAYADSSPLRFGFFPFSIYHFDENYKPSGSAIELIQELANSIDTQLEFIEVPNKRLRTKVTSGEIDLTIATPRYSEFNQNTTLVSEFPFHDIKLMAFTTNQLLKIQNPEDLFGKKVIVRRGYDYLGWRDFIDRHRDKIEIAGIANSTDHALKMLQGGRGDILLEYMGNIDQALSHTPVFQLKSMELTYVPLHLVVSKRHPLASDILEQFTNAFNQFLKDGRINERGRFIAQ